MTSSSSKTYYYARGFGDLKPVSYKNLKEDLSLFPNSDFPEQEQYILSRLEKGQKRRKAKNITLMTGAAVFATGFAMFYLARDNSSPVNGTSVDDGNRSLRVTGLMVSVTGMAGMIGSLLIPKPENSYLKALRRYNQFY